jgi:hypothetical protein
VPIAVQTLFAYASLAVVSELELPPQPPATTTSAETTSANGIAAGLLRLWAAIPLNPPTGLRLMT